MGEKFQQRLAEDNARQRIEDTLSVLSHERTGAIETRTSDDIDSVDYHIENIMKAGGGMWNEAVAKNYIENLTCQPATEFLTVNEFRW